MRKLVIVTGDSSLYNNFKTLRLIKYANANLKILLAGNFIFRATKFDDSVIVLLRSKFLMLLFEGMRTNLHRKECQ
jgi:hypothetical protein